ncbi:hybrid sensor [Candidatus Moduliflexus flocculans]|uniref:histidine kinase n=1 Tax=Candidatus Moduliflexus flocculans TaxID=1499966 RepID=A0A081BM84_9BACT|nr:hybrid sensor [Candidatus Moduliflexus flocculans]
MSDRSVSHEKLAAEIQELQQKLSEREESVRRLQQVVAQANQAKNEFLSIISHEIRTPMNAIMGGAELLLETPLSQEQREFVHVLQSNGDILLRTLNDLLDLSDLHTESLHLESQDFDLLNLIERTCELLASRAQAKGLEFNYYLDPIFPCFLIGDPARLRQILMNLIDNAIKFTSVGEVVVRCELQTASAQEAVWKFSVIDTGIGILPEKLQQIFDLFTQGEMSSVRQFSGTGVGLTISQHLARLMGGRLWVESQEGKGSAFHFTATFGIQTNPHKPIRDYPERLKGLRVLIVDWHETNRVILREILERWDAHVTDAKNSEQGILALRRATTNGEPFDLILLDGDLPSSDSQQIIEHLKQDPIISNLPIMMLTTGEHRRHALEHTEADVSAYMIKPIKRFELLHTIGTILATLSEQKAPRPQPAQVSLPPLRILLVEDYKHNQLIVQQYLKHTPFQIDIAENGAIAVEKFRAGHYDLVLMDLQMPVMDGYAATHLIREFETQEQREATPIIALTAYALKETPENSLRAGCTAYLNKPVKKAELLECIAKYTKHEVIAESPSLADIAQDAAETQRDDNRVVVYIEPDFAEFIPEFFEDIRQDIQVMNDALREQDYQEISRVGHSLKGAGGGYGFNTISDIARSLETAAKEGRAEEITLWINKLRTFIDEVRVVYRTESGEITIVI